MTTASSLLPVIGKPAPDFTLPSSTGESVSLKSFKNRKTVVLYFYPKDDTPGCTREACAFRDLSADFAEKNAVILGVSPDTVESHIAFRDKFHLPFPLLADPEHEVSERYGVWKLRQRDGREFMGVERTTVIIGKDGEIKKLWPNVTVDGHVDEVLAALD